MEPFTQAEVEYIVAYVSKRYSVADQVVAGKKGGFTERVMAMTEGLMPSMVD